jgi:prepilin-type N-terminal cleavage/methylation domain-containing protein
MKRSPARPRFFRLSGFTLIELLVVIAIIAILAAVTLGAGGAVLRSAKRAQAANMATQIQTATLAYYTEYSVYPQDTTAFTAGSDYTIGDGAASADATNWQNLLIALCGNINPNNVGGGVIASPTITTNTRNIPFLSLRQSDLYSSSVTAPKNPIPVGTTAALYFNIAVNSSYSGVLGTGGTTGISNMPNFATGTTTSLSVTGGSSTAGVAVWANCTGITAPASGTMSCNANFWVHTY